MSETLLSCPGCQALILPRSDSCCCPLCGATMQRPDESATSMWFYAAERERKGPVSWPDLQALLRSGSLKPADMVLQAGSKQWQPAQVVPGLVELEPVLLEALPLAPSGILSLLDPSRWDQTIDQKPEPGTWAKPPSGIPLAVETHLPNIPGYEILAELGRGGMGVVYMARQVQLKRVVALKMILGGYVTLEDRARFRIEAESVARLQNPYIVQIYDIGEHEQLPYFSLEYVSGGSLHHQLDGTPRPPRQAAELVRLLALGMQAAHSAGIVHRDLKPGNILLQPASDGTAASAWGIPKISDFGLAKQLDMEARTQTGTVLGTPQYMAPEQARGRVSEVGPWADIYALGAILYEVLTGRPPFQGESTMDTLLLVVDAEPVAPSQLQPKLPRDLETICMKCLEKDYRRRYANCATLADDLQRFLTDQPISARPIGWRERAWKWARRRPAVAGLLAAVVLVGLVGLIGVLTQWRQAVVARAAAEEQTIKTQIALAKAERSNYFHLIALAHREWQVRHVGRARALLKECPEARRDWEWRYLNRLFAPELASVDTGNSLLHVAWSRDGRYIASGGEQGAVKIWDASSRKEIVHCKGHTGQVWQVAFSRDGKLLASGCDDRTARLWEVPSGRLLRTFTGHSSTVHGLAFHPQRDWLVSAGGEVFFWDLENGQRIWQLPKGPDRMQFIAFHPDGERLAVSGYHQTIEFWDLRTGLGSRVPAHERVIYGLAYSPDGRWLASGSADNSVELHDAGTGKRLSQLRVTGGVSDIFFSPDSRRLAAACTDQSVVLWQIGGGGGLVLRGHTEPVHGLAFHPDSQQLVSAGQDGALKFWDARVDPEMTVLAGDTQLQCVAFSADSGLLAASGWGGAVQVWDRGGKLLWSLKESALIRADAIAFSPDGQLLAAGGDCTGSDDIEGVIKIWSLSNGQLVHTLSAAQGVVTSIAFGSRNTLYAGTKPPSGIDNQPAPIVSWDLTTNQKGTVLPGHLGATTGLALSPDGKMLVSGGDDRMVRLWDLASGQELRSLGGHQEEIHAVAFHPDGRRVASASRDRTIKLWHVSGALERTLVGHIKGVECLSFSKDGRRLASGSQDAHVKIWDVATGQDCLSLTRHTNTINGIAFSPDGAALASASQDRKVMLWLAP